MATKRASRSQQLSGTELLGARLRQARVDRNLSLQDVEALTQGTLRAATLSAYELGDSNIRAVRLALLADLYEVSADDLLSSTAGEELARNRRQDPPPPVGQLAHIDLTQLAKAKGEEAKMVTLMVASIRLRRGASAGRYFAMRNDDLLAIATLMERDVEDLLASLQKAGVLRRPRGRPFGRQE